MASTPLNRDRLRDKTMGSLFGVFIGDALGLPVETMGPVEIRTVFGYVDFYIKNKNHKWANIGRCAPGTISDDSQLSLAIMNSLARSGGYNLKDIEKSHVEALDGKWGPPVGWGGSTRHATQRIKAGNRPTMEPEGAGNGTCMKIAPLAIYCVYKTISSPHKKFTNSFNASLLKKCREITMMTHGNPMCVVAAYCQSRMIIRAMQDELPKTSKAIAKLFIEDAEYVENYLSGIQWHWHDDKRLSQRMLSIFEGYDANGQGFVYPLKMNTPDVSCLICTERSSFVYNSYPLVAYCVAKYAPYRNFRHAIVETINAGADADSNASMVGAIMGASLGFHQIPMDLIKNLKKYRLLMQQAKKFEQSL